MARDENLPFPLGTTYFGGDATLLAAVAAEVTAGSFLDGFQYEGQEYTVEDLDQSNGTIGAEASRTYKRKKVRCVRNMNAAAALPKQVAKLNTAGATAGAVQGEINGLVASPADRGYPVDEWLPAAGCAQYDLCWVVVEGCAKVTTDTAGTTTVAVGGVVVPGSTTTGRVVAQDTTQTGANLFNQIQNALGRALTAVAGNSADFLIEVGAGAGAF